ncbi:MAG: Rrf2 family transcriptional regulator, partial [Caulobacteraceae bacterium]|nr:Rrf2 family transcriptional regulator [Caulobacteraceae bacterium]
RCLTHDLWAETGRIIHDYFAGISLADIAEGRLRKPAQAA